MVKPKDDLTVLDQRVIIALVHLHPDGYGVSVQDEILNRTGKNVSLGSIYAAIDRLEQKGFVIPREGDPIPERGGRRKVLFSVSVEGRKALAEALIASDKMRNGLVEGEFA